MTSPRTPDVADLVQDIPVEYRERFLQLLAEDVVGANTLRDELNRYIQTVRALGTALPMVDVGEAERLAQTALALVDYQPRRSRFARLPLAIGVYAIYYNLIGVARTWVEQQSVSVLWWAPGLLAVALLTVSIFRRGTLR